AGGSAGEVESRKHALAPTDSKSARVVPAPRSYRQGSVTGLESAEQNRIPRQYYGVPLFVHFVVEILRLQNLSLCGRELEFLLGFTGRWIVIGYITFFRKINRSVERCFKVTQVIRVIFGSSPQVLKERLGFGCGKR